MEYRQLGSSGLRVPELSFGTGTFGGEGPLFSAWGRSDAVEARRLIDICLEAGLIGVTGAIIGLILGHLLAAAGSAYMRRLMGEGINWTRIGTEEALYLVAVAVIAVLAGFVPAMKAYRTPVATNLVTG
jgi:hypothetical protein